MFHNTEDKKKVVKFPEKPKKLFCIKDQSENGI